MIESYIVNERYTLVLGDRATRTTLKAFSLFEVDDRDSSKGTPAIELHLALVSLFYSTILHL